MATTTQPFPGDTWEELLRKWVAVLNPMNPAFQPFPGDTGAELLRKILGAVRENAGLSNTVDANSFFPGDTEEVILRKILNVLNA